MGLATGTRLGHYEILSLLGAGAMGEVWRARDTRLGRDVAIKVLPGAVASDPDRLGRFEREARSASSLNHPGIVAIYEIGSEQGVSFIAMELVRGQSLRERLERGALPVRELLTIGNEIAEAIARAHVSGIIHRDLKPENLMVTEDGHAKVLDFGLAKLAEEDAGARSPDAPTALATQAGMLIGTVGYMSPEQALGQPLDFRSDQFSLGVILYEMATGRRPFERASAPQTLTAIIEEEPGPLSSEHSAIPAPLAWTIERCLAKDPRHRYAATEDLARDLATIRDRLSLLANRGSAAATASPPVARHRGTVTAVLAAALLVAAASAWLYSRDFFWNNPFAEATFTRLTDWEGSEFDAAISRDGKLVTFLSDRDGPLGVWVTQVGSGSFSEISRGAPRPSYIEGMRAIGFADDDSHVRIRVTPDDTESTLLIPTLGGNARPFLGANATELDWSADGSKVVYHTSEPGDPLYVADRSGGGARVICRAPAGTHQHFLKWSPDGRYVYFVRGVLAASDLDIWRVASSGGDPERLTDLHTQIGYLTFLGARTLLYTATRPDGEGSRLYAMDVEHRIPHQASFGLEEYLSVDASGDGRRLVATVARPDRNLWKVPTSGPSGSDPSPRRFHVPSVRASAPRFGRDFVLYLSSRGGPNGLWKFKDGVETELWRGADGLVPAAPAVSADGGRICFVVRRDGRSQLYLTDEHGTAPRPLAAALDIRDAPSFSPDAKWIVVAAAEGERRQPLFRVPVDGGPPQRLVDGVASSPVWSPDGRFIVYGEARAGRSVHLKAVTPQGRAWPMPDLQASRSIDDPFRFTPDGKAIVVLQGEASAQNFWRLDLATQRLSRLTDLAPGFTTHSFDVSPDGKEILFDRFRNNADLALIQLPPR